METLVSSVCGSKGYCLGGGGLEEEGWLTEDKMEKGQGKEAQKEIGQHADRRDGLGARDAGVGSWTLECASLKCKGSVCRLVEEFNPLLP